MKYDLSMILPHKKPILSMSSAKVSAPKHLQLCLEKAAVYIHACHQGKKSSRLNAIWKTLSHYSETLCSIVISIFLSQMHLLVSEPVSIAVFLQPLWDLLYFHTHLCRFHLAM